MNINLHSFGMSAEIADNNFLIGDCQAPSYDEGVVTLTDEDVKILYNELLKQETKK